jgi:dihydrofolate reductase
MTAAAPMPARPVLSLIAIVDRAGGIGKDNGLLVHLSEDLRHFKRTTLGCPVVMGRRTWDSIGRPLPGRRNIVITRDPAWQAEGAEGAASLDAALALVADAPKVFVIGGAQIFEQALPRANELVLTEIDAVFDADTFFPALPPGDFVETARETQRSDRGFDYSFVTYRRATAPR